MVSPGIIHGLFKINSIFMGLRKTKQNKKQQHTQQQFYPTGEKTETPGFEIVSLKMVIPVSLLHTPKRTLLGCFCSSLQRAAGRREETFSSDRFRMPKSSIRPIKSQPLGSTQTSVSFRTPHRDCESTGRWGGGCCCPALYFNRQRHLTSRTLLRKAKPKPRALFPLRSASRAGEGPWWGSLAGSAQVWRGCRKLPPPVARSAGRLRHPARLS